MSKLFQVKRTYSIDEAAKRLSSTFNETIDAADVLRLMADGELPAFWILDCAPLLRASPYCPLSDKLRPVISRTNVVKFRSGVFQLDTNCSPDTVNWFNALADGREVIDVRAKLDGTLLIDENGEIFETTRIFIRSAEGFVEADVYLNSIDSLNPDEIAQETEYLTARTETICHRHVTHIDDNDESIRIQPGKKYPALNDIFVTRAALESLERKVEQSANGPQAEADKQISTRERDSLLTVIAALCDYSAIDHQGRGAATQISRLTDDIGAHVDDGTVRKWLKLIPEALVARQK